MGTYQSIVNGLRNYADRLGGKGDLMRFLGAKRPTLYRAVNDDKPSLPNPDVLCEWLDKMRVQIVFPGEELEGFVLIPRVEATAGAGESWETSEIVAGTYAFRESFMRHLGVSPKNAVMMYVRGDSMEPLIYDRDTLLIDTNDCNPREGYIYVLALGDAVMVKRLQKTPRGWNICSENKNYRPITIEGQELETMEIKGRVRWFGRVV